MSDTGTSSDKNVQDAVGELNDPFNFEESDEPQAVMLTDQPPFRILKGKYRGLTLPRMVGGVMPSYYDKVLALKEEIAADPKFQRHATSIAWTYAVLRREVDTAAAELSEMKLHLAATMLLMFDQLEAEGVDAVTLANRDKIQVDVQPHLIVTDKSEFRSWCVEQGLENLMSLPWITANKLVKQMLVDGLPEPPGASCWARPKVTFRRGD